MLTQNYDKFVFSNIWEGVVGVDYGPKFSQSHVAPPPTPRRFGGVPNLRRFLDPPLETLKIQLFAKGTSIAGRGINTQIDIYQFNL